MGYSLEYKEWTGADVEADFSIEETSTRLAPELEKEISCDGIGFIAMFKDETGKLMFKMKSEDGEPSEIFSYFDILSIYDGHNSTSPE